MFGECNNYILDSLRGIKEVLLFKAVNERLDEINSKSHRINESLDKIKEHEGIIRAITDLTIMIAILTFVGVGFAQYSMGNIIIYMDACCYSNNCFIIWTSCCFK